MKMHINQQEGNNIYMYVPFVSGPAISKADKYCEDILPLIFAFPPFIPFASI